MKALYDVAAPAKLNLFLHITGRRTDGYHLLQSVFMLIDWCDTLHFELRPGGQISREDLPGSLGHNAFMPPPLPADDLTLRAARALQSIAACPLGVHITLTKRIPQQAGLGGGSSDAASTLLALNRLWGLNLPLAKLLEVGLQLGADVPFFLSGGHAWVEGIGEQLTPLALPAARFRVVKPAAGLETARIFAAAELKRNTQTATISGFAAMPQNCMLSFGRNDLQPVAEQLCPPVTQALQALAAQGLQPRMTGSGSAVFAPIAADADVSEVAGCWVRDCNNLEAHPLRGWAL
ncbi:MAG: 4-(cytidine 5'-diphospho)-2-C-methyl-D-erythritol kinase [Burkholderiaceae bacterium]